MAAKGFKAFLASGTPQMRANRMLVAGYMFIGELLMSIDTLQALKAITSG
jgi:hypothetical protein